MAVKLAAWKSGRHGARGVRRLRHERTSSQPELGSTWRGSGSTSSCWRASWSSRERRSTAGLAPASGWWPRSWRASASAASRSPASGARAGAATRCCAPSTATTESWPRPFPPPATERGRSTPMGPWRQRGSCGPTSSGTTACPSHPMICCSRSPSTRTRPSPIRPAPSSNPCVPRTRPTPTRSSSTGPPCTWMQMPRQASSR